jgi:alkylation response protein AidB-like acyl-CoA dehydrogenase
MDFSLTEEQEMFRGMFRSFAQKEIAKLAEHTDKEEHVPPESLKKAAEQGMLGALVPDTFGGAALDPLSYTLMLEEIGKACMSTAVVIAQHTSQATQAVLDFGSDAQKEQFLPKLAAGEAFGAFALSEPDAGSDAKAITTRAARSGDGGDYVLNGVKTWVGNAGIAGLFIVFAVSDPKADGRGMSAFIIEKDMPGLKVGHREPTLGVRGATYHTIYLDGVHVPEANRLDAEGDGWKIAENSLDHVRLALGAAALGLAESALDAGRSFAVERKQFGVPIATKQAIGDYFAETTIEIESLRHIIQYAAWLAEQKQPFSTEASMIAVLGARTARNATNRMLQVHGGYGFSAEYSITRLYRDARGLDLMGGTTQIQRVLLARDVFEGTGIKVAP